MSLPGPILIVSDRPDRRLAGALAGAGASTVVETGLAEAAATVTRTKPVAILLAGPDPLPQRLFTDALAAAIDALPAPFVPVMMRVKNCGAASLDALPIDFNAPAAALIARLTAMLRVRALHATVLQRMNAVRSAAPKRPGSGRGTGPGTGKGTRTGVPALPASDPLDEATVLVMGRGRHYPELTAAVGERVGLIGAMSPETAARYLNLRDVNGVIIGDGFGPSTVEVFLTALAEDSRFGDLPVGVVPDLPAGIDRARLAGIEPVRGDAEDIVAHMIPLVRVHAFAARLRRHAASLDARGLVDPLSGLFSPSAFDYGLPQMIADCRKRDAALSVARFDLPAALSPRDRIDAARLVSRLIRPGDFAAQDADGAITVVMTDAPLHQCHVLARRIASTIRNTLHCGHDGGAPVDATVTIAALRPTDSPHSLLSRVSGPERAAAE
jgi:GGDEF domain-containing protein